MTGLQTEALDIENCFDNEKKYGFNKCSKQSQKIPIAI